MFFVLVYISHLQTEDIFFKSSKKAQKCPRWSNTLLKSVFTLMLLTPIDLEKFFAIVITNKM